jgi:hypothetical protein
MGESIPGVQGSRVVGECTDLTPNEADQTDCWPGYCSWENQVVGKEEEKHNEMVREELGRQGEEMNETLLHFGQAIDWSGIQGGNVPIEMEKTLGCGI